MDLPHLMRGYFSSQPDREKLFRRLYWIVFVLLVTVLLLFWYPLRSTGFTYSLVSFAIGLWPARAFFRIVTALGSEGFFLALFSTVYWASSKTLGFWGLIVAPLSIFLTSEVPKDIIGLPRPDIPGVAVPTFTFPSGHTSGAVSVWGFLAVVLRRRSMWILSLAMVFLVGLSRVMLGYHFPGDVVGGMVTGMLFLAVFFGLGFRLIASGWMKRVPFALILPASFVVPLFMAFVPVTFAPRLMGYLGGAALGHLLERERLDFNPRCALREQLLRVGIGLAVLGFVTLGLHAVLPPGYPLLIFLQNAVATFWVTYLAPVFFFRLGLV